MNGPARERRKQQRLFKRIESSLLKKFQIAPPTTPTTDEKSNAKSRWNIMPRGRKIIGWIVTSVLALIGIAQLPTIKAIYQVQISLEPQASTDPSDLFATPFLLRNTGYFDATNVQAICSPILEGAAADDLQKNATPGVGYGAQVAQTLKAGGLGATVYCKLPWKLTTSLKPGHFFYISFTVVGRYGLSPKKWLSKDFQHEVWFRAIGDGQGHLRFETWPQDPRLPYVVPEPR